MKLLGNLVLLEPLPKKTVSHGGIILKPSEWWVDKDRLWRVLAVGPGKFVRNRKTKVRTLIPPEVSPGDKVLCNLDTAGDKFRYPDGRTIIDADQILLKW